MRSHPNFNIRVYGILLHEGKLLVNEELIQEQKIIKFPGGGLDFGEGTIDCLKREYKEELNLIIEIKDHFYTTDFFQPSAFDDSQVVSIYYLVTSENVPNEIINTEKNERSYWVDLKDVYESIFTLPIDRIIGGMLRQCYNTK